MSPARLLRLAWRDLKGGLSRLWVVVASLALGVGLIAGIGGVNAALITALERDAAKLLGGDLAYEATNAPVPEAALAATLPEGGRLSRTLRTGSIAFARGGRSAPVEIKAVDAAYPLAGSVTLDPPIPLNDAIAPGRIAIDPLLLARLGIEVGDEVQIGKEWVEVAATIENEPDKIASFAGGGDRVLMRDATLDGLDILLPGALVRYSDRVLLPPGRDAAAEVRRIEAASPDANYRVRAASAVQPRIERVSDRLAAWLTLAGLASLLIGGLGVGLAVGAWLDGKTAMIATLKTTGARGRVIDALLGAEILFLALIGTCLGLVLGALLPQAVRLLPANLLPIDLEPGVALAPLLLAGFVGLLTAALFSVLPLARARDVPAARLFRDAALGDVGGGWRRAWPWLLGLAVLFTVIVVLALPQRWLGAGFIAAALVFGVVLYLLGGAILALLPRLAPRLPGVVRPALRRLARPGSGALPVTGGLAAGLAALTLVTLIDATLRAEIVGDLPDKVPSLVFIDIQPNQREPFTAEIAETGGTVMQMTPILRGRVVRIDGAVPDVASVGPEGRWTLESDRGLTWQGAKRATTDIVAGEWWPADYDGPPLVSVEDEVAKAYGVGVGDTLGFNILGRVIEAEIASLRREIDWSEGQIDFIFIFSPGVLEGAPHTLVAAVDVPKDREAALMGAVAKSMPNLTPIRVGEIIERLGNILEQVGLGLRAVAGVTLIAGGLVLAAAIGASRRRQTQEAVLLKVIGATRRQILVQMLTELALLGAVAGVLGLSLGTLGAWLVAAFALNLPLSLAPTAVLGILALALALTLCVGGLGLGRVLAAPPNRALKGA